MTHRVLFAVDTGVDGGVQRCEVEVLESLAPLVVDFDRVFEDLCLAALEGGSGAQGLIAEEVVELGDKVR